ncbi:MAG TPA: hypothetical protein VEA38_16890 [Terriglobales bacterium]|nr:hypothetical protein [Terriglobales bacterium]
MPDPAVDLARFKRASSMLLASMHGRFTLPLELHTIAQLGYGMDPRTVPVTALQLMGSNPAVYLAERTISGIIRRPDLYSVKHDDPKVRAETEAWLWPLLPTLLGGAARAFAYGTIVSVLDWERKTLRIMVAAEEKGKPRLRTLVEHTHFREAFELHPDSTTFQLDDAGRVVSVVSEGGTYGADRVAPWIWDPEFGSVLGQGARRRSWADYCRHLIVSVLRDKYLERSVDSPRIAYAPEGFVNPEDEERTPIPEFVGTLLDDLRGSGNIVFPSVRDAAGNKKYEVQALDLPDRAEVWDAALNRIEGNIFNAYLMSPSLGAVGGDAGGVASKTLEGMIDEHIEDLASFAAAGLSRLVEIVHRANYDPQKVAPPEIAATDVGKAAARKIYQEVLRLGNGAARGEVALRTDVPALLDKLGIPLRDAPLDPFKHPDPSAPEVGRPENPSSERADRREDARTEEGEEDTGGQDVEREEQE